jgi:hypothetical protein
VHSPLSGLFSGPIDKLRLVSWIEWINIYNFFAWFLCTHTKIQSLQICIF